VGGRILGNQERGGKNGNGFRKIGGRSDKTSDVANRAQKNTSLYGGESEMCALKRHEKEKKKEGTLSHHRSSWGLQN